MQPIAYALVFFFAAAIMATIYAAVPAANSAGIRTRIGTCNPTYMRWSAFGALTVFLFVVWAFALAVQVGQDNIEGISMTSPLAVQNFTLLGFTRDKSAYGVTRLTFLDVYLFVAYVCWHVGGEAGDAVGYGATILSVIANVLVVVLFQNGYFPDGDATFTWSENPWVGVNTIAGVCLLFQLGVHTFKRVTQIDGYPRDGVWPHGLVGKSRVVDQDGMTVVHEPAELLALPFVAVNGKKKSAPRRNARLSKSVWTSKCPESSLPDSLVAGFAFFEMSAMSTFFDSYYNFFVASAFIALPPLLYVLGTRRPGAWFASSAATALIFTAVYFPFLGESASWPILVSQIPDVWQFTTFDSTQVGTFDPDTTETLNLVLASLALAFAAPGIVSHMVGGGLVGTVEGAISDVGMTARGAATFAENFVAGRSGIRHKLLKT